MTDEINPLDLMHRLTVGDWASAGLYTFTALASAGEIVRDPADESRTRWLDKGGNVYTLHAIQSTSWIAKHTRAAAARQTGHQQSADRR